MKEKSMMAQAAKDIGIGFVKIVFGTFQYIGNAGLRLVESDARKR